MGKALIVLAANPAELVVAFIAGHVVATFILFNESLTPWASVGTLVYCPITIVPLLILGACFLVVPFSHACQAYNILAFLASEFSSLVFINLYDLFPA